VSTSPTIIGIDPGLDGALAWQIGACWFFEAVPVLGSKKSKRAYDLSAILGRFQRSPCPVSIYIEGFASFGLGTSAVHSLVRCITAFECAALVSGTPIVVVPSQTWQKVMLANIEPKELKPKAKAKIACERLWGARTAKWSEGMRDAALIAEYGRRDARTGSVVQ
jgi:hypothetical protein